MYKVCSENIKTDSTFTKTGSPHGVMLKVLVYSLEVSLNSSHTISALSVGTVEYIDCISAEGLDFSPNECPWYDNQQSDGVAPVMLELWGMQSTLSLPSLLDPLWPGIVAPDRVK